MERGRNEGAGAKPDLQGQRDLGRGEENQRTPGTQGEAQRQSLQQGLGVGALGCSGSSLGVLTGWGTSLATSKFLG